MSDAKVLILTLNYQQPDLTLRLLASCAQLTYPNIEIAVVDNGSSDNSLERIAATFPAVKLIHSKTNLGFAAGVNLGLNYALATADVAYILLLNNDTIVDPLMLSRLVDCAERYQAAATAPIICYQSMPDRIWSAGAYRQALTNDIRGNQIGQYYRSGRPYPVDYATACGLLIRRQIIEEIGLFDERFFMYYEDLDWCWRLKQHNQLLMIVPKARMWHLVAGTIGGYHSASERYHMALSSVLFFRKYTAGWRWLIVLPFRIISAVKTSLRLIGHDQGWQACRAYWQGLWHGLDHSPKSLSSSAKEQS